MSYFETLVPFFGGFGVGGCLVGSAWCFWYANALKRLREAGQYRAMEILWDDRP